MRSKRIKLNFRAFAISFLSGLIIPIALCGQALCVGEPGFTVYAADFGSGANFGPALPSGTTTYIYTTNPTGGTYLVTNTSGLNGVNWHDGEDHTSGDTDGYMLVFDATNEPGEFSNLLLDGLCPETQYEFRVWVANIVRPSACSGGSIEPDLRFELRHPDTGVLLGSVETGPIPTTEQLEWLPYGLTFTLPAGLSSVQLLLINNAPGGCGNDLAIDDISLRICNPLSEQSASLCEGDSINVNGTWYAQAGTYRDTLDGAVACNDSILIFQLAVVAPRRIIIDTTLCEGESFEYAGKTYRQGGQFRDTLRTQGGCDSMIVELNLSFAAFFASLYVENDSIEMGQFTRLESTASGVGTIRWEWLPPDDLSCTDCPDPVAQPVQTTEYTLLVSDESTGCKADFRTLITVLPCQAFYTPNAFSPNNDGRNDRFEVLTGDCVQAVRKLEVYDRWGGQLYAGEDERVVWDGFCGSDPCPVGLYVYRAELLLLDQSIVEVVGEIQLVR